MVTLAPSKLAEAYQTYPTARAAAVAALRGIDNTQYERGGGVLYSESQNLYAATEPAGQDDDAHLAVGVRIPQGWSLHSIYHTHPSGDRSNQFSSHDISTAKQLKTPSYLLSIDDNKIRVFDPASSKVSKDSMVARFAYGNVVDEGRSRATGR